MVHQVPSLVHLPMECQETFLLHRPITCSTQAPLVPTVGHLGHLTSMDHLTFHTTLPIPGVQTTLVLTIRVGGCQSLLIIAIPPLRPILQTTMDPCQETILLAQEPCLLPPLQSHAFRPRPLTTPVQTPATPATTTTLMLMLNKNCQHTKSSPLSHHV